MKAYYGNYGAPPLAPVARAPAADDRSKDYQVIKKLGAGAFGAALLVERRSDRAQLVAKQVKMGPTMKPADREAARNEVSMLRKLQHPNITRYVDHYESGGSLYIVMEFANGGDLHAKITSRRGIRFTEKEVMHYFCQIALALLYMHEKRILHRDLKTQNVFLTRDGVVKLGDLGISTVLRNTYELKKTVCGTPYYFSPELCQSKPYNNKSDVWALGCILYELTTLQHAFEGNNMKALVQKILKGIYPPIHASYSKDLSGLIASMLRLDPAKRPNVHEIVQNPFVRDHLAALQATASLANQEKRSLVDPAEKAKQHAEAQRRIEEEKALKAKREAEAKAREEQKKREHQQRVEQIRAQMAAEVQQHEEKLKRAKEQAALAAKDQQQAEERRRLEMIDKLRRQEADLKKQEEERRQREAERQKRAAEERARIEADRKRWEEQKKREDEERRARLTKEVALQKKREAEWEKNMKDLQQQPAAAAAVAANKQAPQQGDAPAAGADYRSLDDQARVAAYREMRMQAEANKRKLAEQNKAAPSQPYRVSPVEPAPIARKSPPVGPAQQQQQQQQPPSKEDPESRKNAFYAMRREAEENRRRAAQAEGVPAVSAAGQRPPSSNNQDDKQAVLPNRPPPPQPSGGVPVAAAGGAGGAAGAPGSALNTPANSIDEEARRQVYFQMRREADANRRRLLGQDDKPSPSSSPSSAVPEPPRKVSPSKPAAAAAVSPVEPIVPAAEQQQQQQQVKSEPAAQEAEKEQIVLSDTDDEFDGEDGAAGMHRFLNGEAMADEDGSGSSTGSSDDEDEEEGDAPASASPPAAAGGGGGDADKENPLAVPDSPTKHKHQRRTDYKGVTACIADALDVSKHQSAEDFGDDAASVVDPFTFMLDGKELKMQGVQQGDPLGHRIESLRVYLEQCFGGDFELLKVYRALGKIDDIESEDESEKALESLRQELPSEQRKFVPLVTQLLVCEDVFNMQQNHG